MDGPPQQNIRGPGELVAFGAGHTWMKEQGQNEANEL